MQPTLLLSSKAQHLRVPFLADPCSRQGCREEGQNFLVDILGTWLWNLRQPWLWHKRGRTPKPETLFPLPTAERMWG